jgi:hypothetical protein
MPRGGKPALPIALNQVPEASEGHIWGQAGMRGLYRGRGWEPPFLAAHVISLAGERRML